MKLLKSKVFGIAMGIVAFAGVGLAVGGAAMYGFNFSEIRDDLQRRGHFEHREIVPEGNISRIQIDFRSHNVNVTVGDGFKMSLYEDSEFTRINSGVTEAGMWVINVYNRFRFTMISLPPSAAHNVINITVPSDFDGRIDVTGRSGNFTANGLDVESLTVGMSSGNASVRNVNAGLLMVSSHSGNINMTGSRADVVLVEMRSGNVNMNLPLRESITVSNRSGNNNVTVTGTTASDNRVTMNVRSGNNRLNGVRVGNGTQTNGEGGVVSISNRSGNNNLSFVA